MAPKKGKKKTPVRKKKRPTRKKPVGSHLARSIISLAVLLVLVGVAGVAARHLLARKMPAPVPTPVHTKLNIYQIKQPPKIPVYEIYPKTEIDPSFDKNRLIARKIVPDTPPVAPVKKSKRSRKPTLPKVAIIIDDIGYDPKIVDLFLSIDAPLTFSVLPFSPYQKKVISKVRTKNSEIMLHLPMEPVEYPQVNPGPGALLTSMTAQELSNQLNDALDAIPGAVGINNHMGSRLTTDSDQMGRVMKILKQRGLFFIDSRTSYETVSRELARSLQLPYAQRKVFLDNNTSPEKIKIQLDKLIQYARKQGEAVGIAHPHEETFRVLAREIPKLKQQIRFVPASSMVHVIGG